jgi:putative endonuclease
LTNKTSNNSPPSSSTAPRGRDQGTKKTLFLDSDITKKSNLRGGPNKKRFSGKANSQSLTTNSWSLYIAECADGTYYTGIAKDVEKRIETHNSGKGSKYTATHGPVHLVFQEPQGDYSTALRREYQVKSVPKARKVRLIAGETLSPPDEKGKMTFQTKKKRRKKRKRTRKKKNNF